NENSLHVTSVDSVTVSDLARRYAAVARKPVLVPERDARPFGDVGKAMDARSPGWRGAKMERVRQMRSGMKPVDREPGPHRVDPVDRPERGDAGARGRMNQPGAVRERADHLAEAGELRSVAGGLRLVRRCEMREDPIDL